eukprot:364741-Chlamydomonas_euryale.AAC.15
MLARVRAGPRHEAAAPRGAACGAVLALLRTGKRAGAAGVVLLRHGAVLADAVGMGARRSQMRGRQRRATRAVVRVAVPQRAGR